MSSVQAQGDYSKPFRLILVFLYVMTLITALLVSI